MHLNFRLKMNRYPKRLLQITKNNVLSRTINTVLKTQRKVFSFEREIEIFWPIKTDIINMYLLFASGLNKKRNKSNNLKVVI